MARKENTRRICKNCGFRLLDLARINCPSCKIKMGQVREKEKEEINLEDLGYDCPVCGTYFPSPKLRGFCARCGHNMYFTQASINEVEEWKKKKKTEEKKMTKKKDQDVKPFGLSSADLVMWFGSRGYAVEQTQKVLEKFGLKHSETFVKWGITAGQNPEDWGTVIPTLNDSDIKEIESIVGKPTEKKTPTKPEKKAPPKKKKASVVKTTPKKKVAKKKKKVSSKKK